ELPPPQSKLKNQRRFDIGCGQRVSPHDNRIRSLELLESHSPDIYPRVQLYSLVPKWQEDWVVSAGLKITKNSGRLLQIIPGAGPHGERILFLFRTHLPVKTAVHFGDRGASPFQRLGFEPIQPPTKRYRIKLRQRFKGSFRDQIVIEGDNCILSAESLKKLHVKFARFLAMCATQQCASRIHECMDDIRVTLWR